MNNHPTRVVIVDKDDTPIGVKERSELGAGDIARASAVWITNSHNEALLAQRAFTKNYGAGKWATAAAGAVDEGEDYFDNILKEAKEELDLVLDQGRLVVGQKTFHKSSFQHHHFFCQWYLYHDDIQLEDLTLQESEVANVRWVTRAEMRQWLSKRPDDFFHQETEWIHGWLAAGP